MLGVGHRVRSVVIALATLVATGCASSGPPADEPAAPLGTIVFSEDGCTIGAIDQPIPAGPIALEIVNQTDAAVFANLSEILEGGTYEALEAHIAKEIRLAEAGKRGLGHPSFAPPSFDEFVPAGESDTLTGDVSSGTYAIVCGRDYEEVDEVRPSGVWGPYRVE